MLRIHTSPLIALSVTVAITLGPLCASSAFAQNANDVTTNQFFKTRSEGMSAVVKEITALKQLIRIVQSLPDERGRFRISFDRLLTDLDLVQKGVLETINLPTTAPVQGAASFPAVTADYLE